MHEFEDDRHSMVERIVGRDLDEQSGKGRPLSSRSSQTQRSIEAYLKAGVRPRWMDRVADVDAGIARERRALASAYRELRAQADGDPALFAQRWREIAHAWPFAELNELIAQHNAWYPIERDLPLNPRTGEYVRAAGRSFRRPVLGPEWVLEQFPAAPSCLAAARLQQLRDGGVPEPLLELRRAPASLADEQEPDVGMVERP